MQTPIYIYIGNVGPQGPSGAPAITPIGGTSPFAVPALTGPAIFTVYNTTAAPFIINLPADPLAKQSAQIIDAGLNAGTYSITINGNGNNIIANGVSGSSVEIVSNGGSISLAWDGTNYVQNA